MRTAVATPLAAVAALARIGVLVPVAGVLLGLWCRAAVHSGDPVSSVLAEIGAPWVVTAFAVGALAALGRSDRPARWAVDAVLGGAAGGGALALASYAYYGSTFSAPTPRAAAWALVGLVVGGLAGALGALWRAASGEPLSAVAAGGVGLAVAAEALVHLRVGGLGDDPSTRGVFLALVAAGLLAPLVLSRDRRAGAAAFAAVAVLAVPLSAAMTPVSLAAL